MRLQLFSPALAATLTLLAACHGPDEAAAKPRAPASDEVRLEPNSPKLAFVHAEPVIARNERVVAVLPAQVAFDERRTVRVLPPVAGRIQVVAVDAGQRVAAGAPLATIASGDMAQARTDVLKARAAVTQTSATLARVRDLFEHHVAAARDLEQATSDDAQARAELQRSEARLRALGVTDQGAGDDYVLRAPIGGTIVERNVSSGTEVRPDMSAPLFTISSTDSLWLVVNAYQRDLANVAPGSRLEFTTDALRGQTFAARVSYIGTGLDATTRTVTVRAELSSAGGRLRAQMTGEARVLAPSATPIIVVPTTALVTHGPETTVFVETAPGRFQRRTVSVGSDDGRYATIDTGLTAGERVVTAGSILLDAEADRLR